jgi:hypothetical protein
MEENRYLRAKLGLRRRCNKEEDVSHENINILSAIVFCILKRIMKHGKWRINRR